MGVYNGLNRCVPCVLPCVLCGEKKAPQGTQGSTQGTQGNYNSLVL